MRFASLFLGAILPVAFASPVALVERDANSIVGAVNDISSHIVAVNTTLNTFGPYQLATALKIQGQVDDLGKSLDNATKTTNASQVLNSADSFTVAIAVLNFEPQVFSLLNNIVAHKNAFKNVVPLVGDISFLVKYDLQTQKDKAAQFGNALVSKLDPSLSDAGKNVQKQISDAFDAAIKQFS